MAKIVLNASNLHHGGGVQVATSFFVEAAKLLTNYDWGEQVQFCASNAVHQNLKSINFDFSILGNYTVENSVGRDAIFSIRERRFKDAEVVFTVFGPDYDISRNSTRIVGFAQPWIAYPNNDAYKKLSFTQRLTHKVKFWLQWRFFASANYLIVELPHVKSALSDRYPGDRIAVVRNVLPGMYFNDDQWAQVALPEPSAVRLRLGIATRAYPHKNLGVLPEVKKILREEYDMDIEFWTTLNENEWEATSDEFKVSISNIGSILANQCPDFYRQLDGVIFPTLLEASSLTPLEALVAEKPLFASDRNFVRDICGSYAVYFDPNSPTAIADSIAQYFNNTGDRYNLSDARNHAKQWGNARDRAIQYLDIIDKCVA